MGYPFTVEFNPEIAYVLEGWRAYRSADLPNDWLLNPNLLNEREAQGLLERLDGGHVIVTRIIPEDDPGAVTAGSSGQYVLLSDITLENHVLN